jgi:hypothetical protein
MIEDNWSDQEMSAFCRRFSEIVPILVRNQPKLAQFPRRPQPTLPPNVSNPWKCQPLPTFLCTRSLDSRHFRAMACRQSLPFSSANQFRPQFRSSFDVGQQPVLPLLPMLPTSPFHYATSTIPSPFIMPHLRNSFGLPHTAGRWHCSSAENATGKVRGVGRHLDGTWVPSFGIISVPFLPTRRCHFRAIPSPTSTSLHVLYCCAAAIPDGHSSPPPLLLLLQCPLCVALSNAAAAAEE